MSEVQETGVVSVERRSPSPSQGFTTTSRADIPPQTRSQYQHLELTANSSIGNPTHQTNPTDLKEPTERWRRSSFETDAQPGPSRAALPQPSTSAIDAPLILGEIDHGAGFHSGIDVGNDDGLARPVNLDGKQGIMYPGSNVVYPFIPDAQNDNPSPGYSTFDPNSGASAVIRNDTDVPPSSHTTQSRSLESYSQPQRKSFDIAADSLDADGFTAEERAEHNRSILLLRKLRIVTYTRFLLRTLTIIITSIALILAVVVIDHFHKATKDHSLPNGMSLRPTSVLASFGGITMLISMVLLILCSFMPRLRRITKLSNAVFTTISLIGIVSWVSSCLYLYHGRGKGRNLWYYTCTAARAYRPDEAAETSPSRRSNAEDADYSRLDRMCHMTNAAWAMAVAVCVIEILTLLNVIIAIVLVKGSNLGAWLKKNRGTARP